MICRGLKTINELDEAKEKEKSKREKCKCETMLAVQAAEAALAVPTVSSEADPFVGLKSFLLD